MTSFRHRRSSDERQTLPQRDQGSAVNVSVALDAPFGFEQPRWTHGRGNPLTTRGIDDQVPLGQESLHTKRREARRAPATSLILVAISHPAFVSLEARHRLAASSSRVTPSWSDKSPTTIRICTAGCAARTSSSWRSAVANAHPRMVPCNCSLAAPANSACLAPRSRWISSQSCRLGERVRTTGSTEL